MSPFKNISAFTFTDDKKQKLAEDSCAALAGAILEALGSKDISYMCRFAESLYNNEAGKVYFQDEQGYHGYVSYNADNGFQVNIRNLFEKDEETGARMTMINEALAQIPS